MTTEPAFPNPELSNAHYGNPEGYTGITIRDYFAAAALPALTQNSGHLSADIARWSYELADTMMAAREPKPGLAGLESYKHETALFA